MGRSTFFLWLFIAANREMMSLGARPDAILSPLGARSFDANTIEGDWEFDSRLHLATALLTCNNNIYAQLLDASNHLR
jgi:hypothetical protein